MPVLNEWKLDLDSDMVLHAQGADPARVRARHSPAVAVAEHALEIGMPLLAPAVAYSDLAVRGLRHERLAVGEQRFLSGTLIAEHLCAATEMVVAVCTIGPALEERVSQSFHDDPALGVALDALGSAAVDALGAAFCGWVDTRAAIAGTQTTMPLSPGLIGWPVDTGQREIFALVDAASVGVVLTEGMMMKPHKSTSLVIGTGPDVLHAGDSCDYCALKDTCRYRGTHRAHHG